MTYLYFSFLLAMSVAAGFGCFKIAFIGGYCTTTRNDAAIEATVCGNIVFILGLFNWATSIMI